MAITKKTEALVNELIQGMTRSAIETYKAGSTIDAEDIESLASLISSVQGGECYGSPVCGFVIPAPTEGGGVDEE
ncbi:hypothetical protein [Paenibacillus odorifer]|uniref:hypothetical protein n=1 Tax=Paenibacillus TaxID=44249 RepID=UPI00096C0B69|nr:hypothetical protein [Paenibacillus odorifer]OMD00895.1 hypothetical protein BJP46_18880 [Paenibacillus odorifer]